MTGNTHIRIGLATTGMIYVLSAGKIFDFPIETEFLPVLSAIIGTTIGGLLPDIDNEGTTISKFAPFVTKIITKLAAQGVRGCYHRHLFHSLLFLPVIFALLGFRYWDDANFKMLFIGLFIGTVMHCLADAFISNTWLLYPIIKKPITALNLKQAENRKAYTKVEKFCSVMANSAIFFVVLNLATFLLLGTTLLPKV